MRHKSGRRHSIGLGKVNYESFNVPRILRPTSLENVKGIKQGCQHKYLAVSTFIRCQQKYLVM